MVVAVEGGGVVEGGGMVEGGSSFSLLLFVLLKTRDHGFSHRRKISISHHHRDR